IRDALKYFGVRREQQQQQQSNGGTEGQNEDGAGTAVLRTPSPLRTPTPTSSQDKAGWLPSLLSSVPRSLSRIVASPFNRKRAGRTPRTESRVQSLRGPQYSFSPGFSKWASKFTRGKSLNFGVSSSQESSSEQGSQESQADEKKKVDEETTAVKEVPKAQPQPESQQHQEPAPSQPQKKPQKTKKLIKKQEENYDDLEYSLLPHPLDISPMFEDEHDVILPSIERSDSPPPQSCPTSDDLEETIYRDGIPLWDSEKTQSEKRKRREKEYEVSEDQGGAKWEAYSSREATEEYD
ncbi:trifunctional histidinol dehydrogenase, partial [Ascosphaera pollenicola]